MARRAKFGQTPRVQPSLSNTLVSIAREMVNREDLNIMDAWKNGGEVDGKPVTDKMVLGYWNARKEGIDHDDPVYDTMMNQIEQLQYAIQQSEMDLKHLQGKVSDREFANFYLKWAKKAPRNSEWWRSLQKDAAQLMEAAKNRSRQSAASAKAEAFNAFQTNVFDRDISIGKELAAAMQKMSQETGKSLTDHGDELLALVTSDYASHPDEYHALRTALAKGDPNFSGTFDAHYFSSAMSAATAGYGRIADRANKDGYVSNFASASKGQADMAWFGTNAKAWPVATAYDRAYAILQKTTGDPNSSEMDKRAALAAFATVAHDLAKTPGIDTDVAVMLNADGDRALGIDVPDVPSFGPAMLGTSHPGVPPETAAIVATWNQHDADIKAHPELWEYAPVDKAGNFDPTGKGPIGIVDQNTVPNDAVMVAVPGLDGVARLISVKPNTVYMEDPNNPSIGNSQNGVAVGRSLTYQVGGQTVTLYETGGSDGKPRWSTSSPFNSNLKSTTDEAGNVHLVADVPPQTSAARAAAVYAAAQKIDAENGTAIADTLVTRDANGAISGLAVTKSSSWGKSGSAESGVTGGVTVTFDDKGFHLSKVNTGYAGGSAINGGSITVDLGMPGMQTSEQVLRQTALDQSRFTGGDMPGITFHSTMAASTDAFGNTLTTEQLKALVNDPEFVHAFITQENEALGITNPLLDTRGYDAFARFKTGVMARRDTIMDNPMARGVDAFQRATTRADLSYPGGTKPGEPADVPSITFAGQTLRIPSAKIAGIMNTENRLAPDPTAALGGGWKSSVLQPGAVPGAPPVMGTTTIPGTTTTPTTTTKTTTVTPTVMPTSTPTPTGTTSGSPYLNTTKINNLQDLA